MGNLQEYEEEVHVEGDELVEDLISTWIFFSPSLELTKLILELNDKLGSQYFRQHYQPGTGPTAEDSQTFRQGLQKAFDILFHKSEQRKFEDQSEEEIISGFQAFFSERIFNHLAMLSRTPYARSGTFSIREELTIELAEKIGLGIYLHEKTLPELREETEKVLLRLAWEFQHWFIGVQNGFFSTVWGSLLSVDREDVREQVPGNSIVLVPDVDEIPAAS